MYDVHTMGKVQYSGQLSAMKSSVFCHTVIPGENDAAARQRDCKLLALFRMANPYDKAFTTRFSLRLHNFRAPLERKFSFLVLLIAK